VCNIPSLPSTTTAYHCHTTAGSLPLQIQQHKFRKARKRKGGGNSWLNFAQTRAPHHQPYGGCCPLCCRNHSQLNTTATPPPMEAGTGIGVRPLDYSAGGRATLARFFRSVPLLSLSRPHSSVLTLRDCDPLSNALTVRGAHSAYRSCCANVSYSSSHVRSADAGRPPRHVGPSVG
jgi:hypothetical protein